jgi:YidC/Oxa1 family membrane protein insertase
MKAMQEISPKVEAIQQRYKNEPQKAQAEIVALYRENGVNPLSGCLPILIQIPFLFSMLHLFKTNFSLRGASFIPGWIDDLAAPDVLFNWGYPLPFIGSDFHLLPILLGLTMLAQGLLNSSAKASMNETQRQQKAMNNVMTIAFTFMFYSLPAGLNLYWLFSSLLGIVQQAWQSGKFSTKKHS